ncbi:MAG: hypothetical protein KKG64_01585 [Firmicutes bacterium]|nr:hypothetical protein [Bacillota bacterium]
MKNFILLIAFIIALGLSLVYEPFTDTIDVVAGATNTTYNTNIDVITGATALNGDQYDDDDDSEFDDD